MRKNTEHRAAGNGGSGSADLSIGRPMQYMDFLKWHTSPCDPPSLYRLVAENTTDVIWMMNLEYEFLYVNPAIERLTGHTPEQWVGSNLSKHADPFHFEQIRKLNVEDLSRSPDCTGRVLETCILDVNGENVPVEITGRLLYNKNGFPESILGTARDIRKRRKSEEKLKRIEWLLCPNTQDTGPMAPSYGDLTRLNSDRTLIDAVGSDILTDIAGEYLDLLGTWTSIFEAGGGYALHLMASGWCCLLDQASRDACGTEDNRMAIESGNWLFHERRWEVSRAAMERAEPVDAEFPCGIRIFAVPIRAQSKIVGAVSIGYGDPPREGERLQALARKYGIDLESLRAEVAAYDSRPPFIIEMAKRRLLSSARLIGEITERKQLENEKIKLEQQLLHAQKLEAIGTLAGGIAHDFNNVLASILGYSELALMDIEKDSPLAVSVQQIRSAGFRARDLVRQILAFSRQDKFEQVPVWAKLLVKEALKLLRASIPSSIVIREDLRSDSLVMGDPSQIHQILLNLCTNAVQAMADQKGQIRVTLEDVAIDEVFARQNPPATPGNYLKMTVADNGPGMSRDILERIFDPFFTTKSAEQGTGLGLSMINGIVKKHAGFILVDSLPGKGSTFSIHLPKADGTKPPIRIAESPIPTGTERILFVDDEPQIADLGRKMLEKLGYRVEIRTGGRQAAELLRAEAEGFDMVITDMTMPHKNGIDLAHTLRGLRPDLPIILCTGFSSLIDRKKALQLGFSDFLYKPIAKEQLARAIRRVLDGKGA